MYLRVILVVVAIVACGAATYAFVEAVLTLRSARRFLDETGARLLPLMRKTETTIDAVNAELTRVDAIVSQLEEVSDRVSSTTSAVHEAVSAPREAVSAVSSRIRNAYVAWRRERRTR